MDWLGADSSAIRSVPVLGEYQAVSADWQHMAFMINSANGGTKVAVSLLTQMKQVCSNTPVLMFGFSQGAWVAGDALTKVIAANSTRDWARAQVVRVGLLADARYSGKQSNVWYEPYDHEGAGIALARGDIGANRGVVTSYCHPNDRVCNNLGQQNHGDIYSCFEGLVARDMSNRLAGVLNWAASVPVVPKCNARALDNKFLDYEGKTYYLTANRRKPALTALELEGPVSQRCFTARGAKSLTSAFQFTPFVAAGDEVSFPPRSERTAVCVNPDEVRNRAVGPSGTLSPFGWWVDEKLMTHKIPDAPSADCYAERSGSRGTLNDMHQVEFLTMGLPGREMPVCLAGKANAGKVLQLRSDQRSSGITYLVDGSGSRHHIPDLQTLSCLLSWQNRGTLGDLTWAHIRSLPESDSKATCAPPRTLVGKILRGPSGNAYTVDSSLVKHSIDTGYTYNCLVDRGVEVLNVSQGQIDGVRSGRSAANCISPPRVEGQIIRRDDGVSWVVVEGKRQHIPTLSVDVCARAVHRRTVALSGLDYDAAASIPESPTKYSCNIEGTVVQALDRPEPYPAYRISGGKRYWIPDGWTFDYWKRRLPIIGSYDETIVKELPDGGSDARKLDPAAIPANTIIRRSDGVSWVVDANKMRHHIPFSRDDTCWRYLKGYTVSATGLTYEQANSLKESDPWPCVVGPKVVKSDDGKSYFVDASNTRHWIPDTETFAALSRKYPVVGPWPASEVANFLPGADQPRMLDPEAVKNSIICRNDGICWAVDGGGVRHHIPTYGDNVCWRWVNGWKVTRNGITAELANSLAEAEPWGCSMNNKIIATNEGHAYYMEGNTRHWIPDGYDFECLQRGRTVIRGMSLSEASGLPETSAMPAQECAGINIVTIYSPAANRFVTTEIHYSGSNYAMIRAARTSVGSDWERFRLIGDCANRCLIQSLNNRKLVMPQLDYQGYAWGEMRGVSSNPGGSWEGFRLVGDCNTGCGILALGNGRYVSTELDYTGAGWGMLRARATSIQGWERYIIR